MIPNLMRLSINELWEQSVHMAYTKLSNDGDKRNEHQTLWFNLQQTIVLYQQAKQRRLWSMIAI